MPTYHIVSLPGDGIGPDVTREALKVSKAIGQYYNTEIDITEYLVGGASIDEHGVPIRDEVLDKAKKADAVFLGAVGGPKWDDVAKNKRPEAALLKLRNELGLFTNLRPVRVYEPLIETSTLKREVIENVDLLVVRELTGGIYFGKPRITEKLSFGERAVDTMVYRSSEIERIAEVAFKAARKRRKKLTSVDKSNILDTSRLWRKTVDQVARKYDDIEVSHMLVDNCAMQLVRDPSQFDVILTGNMFGDILSDESAMLTGSIGMLPSASLGKDSAMYEPVHGSAPDIAGSGKANPLAAIGSAALMYRYSFDNNDAATDIEQAIYDVLADGYRTADLQSGGSNEKVISTAEMSNAIIDRINQKQESTTNA